MASRLQLTIETPAGDLAAMVARLRGLGFSVATGTGVAPADCDGTLPDETLLAALAAIPPDVRPSIHVVADMGDGRPEKGPAVPGEIPLRAAIDAMSEGVVVSDDQGRIVMVNPAIGRLLGYETDELLGRNVAMLAPEPVRGSHDDFIASYRRSGAAKVVGKGPREIEAVHKNGTIVTAEVTLSETVDQGRRSFIVVLRDVTERRLAENALRQSEANMLKAQRLARLGNWTWNVTEDVLEWSAETYRLYAITPEEHDGTSEAYYSRVHADEEAEVRAHIQAVVDGMPRCDIEHRIVRKDGEVRILHVLGEVERDPSGKTLRLFGTAQDVTEDRRKDERLRESEQRLAEAASMAQVGYMEWEVATERSSFCSEIYAAIHGVTPAEFIARASAIDAPHQFTHPDDTERFRAAVRALRSTGEPQELEYRLITPQGETRHVRESLKCRKDPAGRITHEMCTLQDLTALRAAEQRLIHAQKREAIGNLTGGVAHDFNNILAVILGHLEMLAQHLGNDPELMDLLGTTIGATERGAGLTRQLLAFARKQELEPEIVEIDGLVARMEELLRRTFSASIRIEISPKAPGARVRVDPGQLEAALLNLAINASDAMPGGGKLVIASSIVTLDEAAVAGNPDARCGEHVCISVLDTGHGIPRDVIDKVFEPFFTTKGLGAGTGLGLSMVSGFVQQSGGHINLYSEEGKGTHIRLYLPLNEQQATAAPAREEPVFHTATILLVEDDPDVRQTATNLLKRRGHHVIGAADGPSAISLLAETDGIDLLFSDMIMPGGMNGNELAHRALEIRPDLRVLLTSGYPGDAFLDGRRFAFLPKPYNGRALSQAIQDALDRPIHSDEPAS